MRVLIAGASGFIGAHVARACAAAGHEVIYGGRHAPDLPGTRHLKLDYAAPAPRDALAAGLRGVDVVVNAVGILRPTGKQTFEALHVRGPRALFAAAAVAGVRRVIQVSALGAEPQAISDYHRSKSEADRALMMMPLDWAVVMPSLVYGPGGASARLFDTLASLPLIPLPAGGMQRIQPVHIDDVTGALLRLIESPVELRCAVQLVGAEPTTLADFLRTLRAALGFRPARTVSVPRPLIAAAAKLGDRLPGAFLSRETLGMLERGNVGDSSAITRLLGRPPLPVSAFVNPAVARECPPGSSAGLDCAAAAPERGLHVAHRRHRLARAAIRRRPRAAAADRRVGGAGAGAVGWRRDFRHGTRRSHAAAATFAAFSGPRRSCWWRSTPPSSAHSCLSCGSSPSDRWRRTCPYW